MVVFLICHTCAKYFGPSVISSVPFCAMIDRKFFPPKCIRSASTIISFLFSNFEVLRHIQAASIISFLFTMHINFDLS